MGPSAVLRIRGIRLLIMSEPTYDWLDEQYRAVGLDPRQAKFIGAKNPMNYRFAYGEYRNGDDRRRYARPNSRRCAAFAVPADRPAGIPLRRFPGSAPRRALEEKKRRAGG